MTDETKVEQSAEELSKEQSSKQNSEGTDNGTPTIEKLAETIQGLQKGYTVTRQEFAEVRENLQNIADSLNQKSGAEQGTDEYVTVGKLKEVLASSYQENQDREAKNKEARIREADREIDRIAAELEADGIITSPKDRDDIMEFAVKEGILDLNRAAAKWIKSQGSEKANEIAKAKVRQEEGSKVGTSSTNAGEESKGLDYQKVQEMRREYGF